MTEKDIDGEVAALVAQAEGVRESDEGVASVLLAAAQTELEVLREANEKLREDLAQARCEAEAGAKDCAKGMRAYK